MELSNRFSIIIIILIVTLISLVQSSCGLLDSKERSSSGNLSGSVLTSDTGVGISNARIRVFNEDLLTTETLTDENGEFNFQNLETGKKTIQLILPQGFLFLGDPQNVINIEGNLSIKFLAEPIREITKTIIPGSVDTLATSSGAFIEVDAMSSNRSIDVSIEEVNTYGDDFEFDSIPVRISIRQQGQPKRVDGEFGLNNYSFESESIHFKVSQIFDGLPDLTSFVYNVGSESDPIYLYADASSTTYRDPNTGIEKTVPLHSFSAGDDIDFSAEISLALSDPDCPNNEYPNIRRLEPIFHDQNGITDVILIHGWQPKKRKCSQFEVGNYDPISSSFSELLEALRNEDSFSSKYNFHSYIYPTNASILVASNDLNNRIKDQGLNNPILIGHSMGGLVGRGLMLLEEHVGLAGLITLGTPHEGSPLADKSWISENSSCNPFNQDKIFCGISFIGGSLLLGTDGAKDLSPENDFIKQLKLSENNKVFTIGGLLPSNYTGDSNYERGNSWLLEDGFESDGVVPTQSAVPSWSSLQTLLENHDHSEISNTLRVAEQIMPILSVLSECPAPPDRPSSNQFNISGSVAREGDRLVRITLNAISVDGNIATDLNKNNFSVIENDCVRNITNFSTDNVGVDIVFVQDLSGSMGSAISGVRSSVINFANDLAGRGINAQFASIGYSGPGNIPTTPPTSPCEFLGPFQDLTDVNSFQSHVSSSWLATGGCDFPENGLEAIQYAHENVSWRPGAARVYIDITDVSHHTAETNCNGLGPCTDQTLESIIEMVGETSTIHVVAPSSHAARTAEGGLDPWKLAEATGGEELVLPADGFVDLNTLGIANVVGEAITFTFDSASPQQAVHSLRIRAEINGKVAELAPALVTYKSIHPQLSHIK